MKKTVTTAICICSMANSVVFDLGARETIQTASTHNRAASLKSPGLVGQLTFGSVFPRTNSVSIEQSLTPIINSPIDYAKTHPDSRITLEGHCDVQGLRNDNLTLSALRRHAVATLFTRKGVAQERIELFLHGEARASASVRDANGHIDYRRVTITLASTRAKT